MLECDDDWLGLGLRAGCCVAAASVDVLRPRVDVAAVVLGVAMLGPRKCVVARVAAAPFPVVPAAVVVVVLGARACSGVGVCCAFVADVSGIVDIGAPAVFVSVSAAAAKPLTALLRETRCRTACHLHTGKGNGVG